MKFFVTFRHSTTETVVAASTREAFEKALESLISHRHAGARVEIASIVPESAHLPHLASLPGVLTPNPPPRPGGKSPPPSSTPGTPTVKGHTLTDAKAKAA